MNDNKQKDDVIELDSSCLEEIADHEETDLGVEILKDEDLDCVSGGFRFNACVMIFS